MSNKQMVMEKQIKIKKIQIKHPELGEILINSEVSDEVNNMIGTITHDYAKLPSYYHAKITENEDGTFKIKDLHHISPETINIGVKRVSGGLKTYVNIITNKSVSKDLIIYPNAVLAIIEE